MWFEKNGKVLVAMPGVPHEMKRMMTERVIPKLCEAFKMPVITHRIIRTIGIGESMLADKISSWEHSLPDHIKLAYLPGLGEVKLRLTGFGSSEEKLKTEIDDLVEKIKPLASQYIYAYGDHTLEETIGQILRSKNLTLSIAESCTGGYLSHLITSVPGCSDYFLGSMIPYAYEIKIYPNLFLIFITQFSECKCSTYTRYKFCFLHKI